MADETHEGVGIRITSDPDTTSIKQPDQRSAQKIGQRSLRLLLAGDLTPEATDIDWAGPSRVRSVDKHRFAAFMQEMTPRLTLEVPNTISETPPLLELELHFPDLDAFHPEQVAQQIPPLAQLAQLRGLVQAVKVGAIDVEAFRAHLHETSIDAEWAEQLYHTLSRPPQAAAPKPPPAPKPPDKGDDSLDRLLGLVALDDKEAETPVEDAGTTSLLGSLVQAIGAAGSQPQVEKTAAEVLLADLDAVLSEQLNAILGAAAFRQLEGAWRGLKFLIDRITFRKSIRLEVLPVSKADLDEALYHQVLMPEHDPAPDHQPLSAVVLDFTFDNGTADLALLADLAETGASLQVPLIGNVGPAFFGMAEPGGLARLPVLWQHLDDPVYIEWHKLREKQEARYLALALPSFLLRYAYGPDHPVQAFGFTEEGQLWGRASLAVAVRMAESFAQTGWPTHLVGERERRLEDLPLWQTRNGATPLAALISDSKFGEFKKAGFIVLGGKPNRDSLFIARASTVRLPESYEDLLATAEAREHITLACQLFVAQAAHHVFALQEAIAPQADIEQARQEVEARMRAFFHTEGHQVPREVVHVQHVADSGLPEHELFAIRLQAPSFILDRPVELVLGIQVPKTVSA